MHGFIFKLESLPPKVFFAITRAFFAPTGGPFFLIGQKKGALRMHTLL